MPKLNETQILINNQKHHEFDQNNFVFENDDDDYDYYELEDLIIPDLNNNSNMEIDSEDDFDYDSYDEYVSEEDDFSDLEFADYLDPEEDETEQLEEVDYNEKPWVHPLYEDLDEYLYEFFDSNYHNLNVVNVYPTTIIIQVILDQIIGKYGNELKTLDDLNVYLNDLFNKTFEFCEDQSSYNYRGLTEFVKNNC